MSDTAAPVRLTPTALHEFKSHQGVPVLLDGPNAHGINQTIELIDVLFAIPYAIVKRLADGFQLTDLTFVFDKDLLGTLRKGFKGIKAVKAEITDLTLDEWETLTDHVKNRAFGLIRALRGE